MEKNKNNSGGIGFTSLLTLLFIGLKLTHYINWGWFWILSPLWILYLIIILVLIVDLIINIKKL